MIIKSSIVKTVLGVQKSLVTTTTTRRKEQQEMIRKAFQAEEERKRVGRERFPMTTIPVNHLAAYEPAIHHASEEHEEGEAILYRARAFGSGGMPRTSGVTRMTARIYVPPNCTN